MARSTARSMRRASSHDANGAVTASSADAMRAVSARTAGRGSPA